jgi:hypothetical protein
MAQDAPAAPSSSSPDAAPLGRDAPAAPDGPALADSASALDTAAPANPAGAPDAAPAADGRPPAGERLWFDRELTFTGSRFVIPSPLDSWTKPIDYVNGRIELRAIVRRNPRSTPVWLELIFWQGSIGDRRHDCLRCIPPSSLSKPGTATCSATRADESTGWGVGCFYDRMDFTTRIGAIQLDAKYTMDGTNRERRTLTGADVPFVVRYTAVLVPAGQKFSGWQNYLAAP